MAHQVDDPAVIAVAGLLLWCAFISCPRNFCMPQVWTKKKKKEEANASDFYFYTFIHHVPGGKTWLLKGIDQIYRKKPWGSLNFLVFTKT